MELTKIFKPVADKQSLAELFVQSYSNPKTQVPYRLALKRFYEYLTRSEIESLNEVTLEVAEMFKADLEMDYSPKTCSMTIATVKEFYQWIKVRLDNSNGLKEHLGLADRDWINMEILSLKNTKVCSREQHTATLTENEAKKLLEVAYNQTDKFQSNQSKIMLLIMLNAGLRVQELTQLKLTSLQVKQGQFVISIIGKGMRRRLISLSKSVTIELQSIFNECNFQDDHYLMQGQDNASNSNPLKPITAANIWKRIKRLSSQAKIDKDISPHSLRRTCATIMYKRKAPIETIQRVLGHDNAQTTQRYIDMEIDMEVSAEYALDLTGEAV
jgi:integrase/recombinase XerD